MTRLLSAAALVGAALSLAACVGSDLERGVGGAAVGAVAASATGNDPLVGAGVGAVAGVYCDNVTRLCQDR